MYINRADLHETTISHYASLVSQFYLYSAKSYQTSSGGTLNCNV